MKGITLTEVLVVTAISAIMLVILVRFFSTGYPLSREIFEQASAIETSRNQLRRITKALRELRESDTGGYPLVATEPQQLIFYSDVDSDDVTERLRYELSGSELHRGVLKPSGDPLTYDPANEVSTVVAGHIQNGTNPIFTYYSGDYPTDATPLTPTDLTEVKYIEFNLLVDTDPNNEPEAIDLVSQVQLRNLKTNLGQQVEGSQDGGDDDDDDEEDEDDEDDDEDDDDD